MIHHLSASQIGQFGRCAYQWYLKKTLGPRPPGFALIVGSSVHVAAEVGLRHKLDTGDNLKKDDVTDAAATAYADKIDADGVLVTSEEKGRATLLLGENKDKAVRLAGAWSDDVGPIIKPRLIEDRMDLEVPGLDVPIRGILDVYETDGTLRDLKTAKKSWNQEQIDGEIAPTIYREMILARYGIEPGRIAYDILVDKKKGPEHQLLETVRNEQDFETIIYRAQALLSAYKAGAFPPATPGAWWCSEKSCGYWHTCKYISPRLRGAKG